MSHGPQNRVASVAAQLFLLGGLASLGVLVAWVFRGKAPLPWGVAGHVSVWCLGALAGLTGWGYLRCGGGARERYRFLARTALLLFSVVVSLAILFEMPGSTLIAAAWLGQVPPLAIVPAVVLMFVGIALVIRTTTGPGDAPSETPPA